MIKSSTTQTKTLSILLIASVLIFANACNTQEQQSPSLIASPSITATPSPLPTRLGAPNISRQEITIFMLCSQSGFDAEFNQSKIFAAQDMTDFININGGIFGAQLDLRLIDTKGELESILSAYERIKGFKPKPAVILICDARTEIALAELLEADQIVGMGPGLASPLDYESDESFLVSYNARVDEQFALWLDYLAQNWLEIRPNGAGEQVRISIVSWPEEEGGPLGDSNVLSYASELGFVITDQPVVAAQTNANVYDAIYRARDVNSNVIYVQGRGAALAEVMNAVNALGLRERFIIAGPAQAFDSLALPYLLQPAFVQGAYVSLTTPWWTDESKPFIDLASELFAANEREEELKDAGYLSILQGIEFLRRGLENAVLAKDIDALDGRSLQTALFTLTDYPEAYELFTIYHSDSGPDGAQIWQIGEHPSELQLVQDFSPLATLEVNIGEEQ